jgi:hypothetical protein
MRGWNQWKPEENRILRSSMISALHQIFFYVIKSRRMKLVQCVASLREKEKLYMGFVEK